ncbi:MAG: hypothetical protein ACRC7S_02630 [Cetobacterium sp.]
MQMAINIVLTLISLISASVSIYFIIDIFKNKYYKFTLLFLIPLLYNIYFLGGVLWN